MTQDSMIVITPLQLKKTNLIFLEHKKFSEEIPLLQIQISNLEKINKDLAVADSFRAKQLGKCLIQLQSNNDMLLDLNKTLEKEKAKNKKLKNWTIGGVSIGLLAVIFAIIK